MGLEMGIPMKVFLETMKSRDIDQEYKLFKAYTETEGHEKQYVQLNQQVAQLNRYCNILPFSHSIVKPDIQVEQNKFSTPRDKFYINANYIKDICNQEKAYIATQGPIQSSLNDFWHMVWTNNVGFILMLCHLKEKGRSQCEQYWPEQGTKFQFGQYEVQMIQSKQLENQLLENKFRITLNSTEMKEVTQYWWQGWPDFGVPQEGSLLVLDWLAQQINQASLAGRRPVIHCSAGVGRTGTVFAICLIRGLIDHYKRHGDMGGRISVFSIARRLREQRPHMIQTSDQYKLIYKYAVWMIENIK